MSDLAVSPASPSSRVTTIARRGRIESVDVVRGLIIIVMALYPLCKWYAGLRRRSGAWWMSYL